MLVLERAEGEKILIGDHVVVTLLRDARGRKKTRLGIDAPRDVKILREEIKRFPKNRDDLSKSAEVFASLIAKVEAMVEVIRLNKQKMRGSHLDQANDQIAAIEFVLAMIVDAQEQL